MYCTINQLEDRLTTAVLNQRIPETGANRVRVLDGYIERASARIDAVLSVRYVTPIVGGPSLLADICLTIALWQIEADRGSYSDKLPERVQVPYDEAIITLKQLASGTGGGLSGATVAPGAVAGLVVISPPSNFAYNDPGMRYF